MTMPDRPATLNTDRIRQLITPWEVDPDWQNTFATTVAETLPLVDLDELKLSGDSALPHYLGTSDVAEFVLTYALYPTKLASIRSSEKPMVPLTVNALENMIGAAIRLGIKLKERADG